MRELRYVGPGVEPDRVIVELVDGSEQFSLPVAAVVHHSTQTDLLGAPAPTVVDGPESGTPPPPPVAEPEAQPMTTTAPPVARTAPVVTLTPRDIQVRVRAGESPEQLAAQSGDDLTRIMRFAAPVLAERVRISDEARRGRARRNNADAQTTVFGVAVEERFGQHGVDLADVRWDAYRRGDGQWIVTASWPESGQLGDSGGSGDSGAERQADWSFNLTTRTVTPLDDHAVELLSDRPIQPARPAGETHRPALTVAPPITDGVVPFPANPDAYTGPLPRDDVFDQEAFGADGDGELRTATSPVPTPMTTPAARSAHKPMRAVPSPAPASRVEPVAEPDGPAAELPLDLPKSVAADEIDDPAEDDGAEDARVTNLGIAHRGSGSRATKPKMPSWDDILMGVRRKTD